MSAVLETSAVQPVELSLLVDLEARWENLRGNRVVNAGKGDTAVHLQQRQKAYEAFHGKLASYNKTFTPAHVPELLLNTPQRLGEWCCKMRTLLARMEGAAPRAPYPVHLLEKAYRSAERVADRLKKEPPTRPAPSSEISGAIRELEELATWCERVAPVA